MTENSRHQPARFKWWDDPHNNPREEGAYLFHPDGSGKYLAHVWNTGWGEIKMFLFRPVAGYKDEEFVDIPVHTLEDGKLFVESLFRLGGYS